MVAIAWFSVLSQALIVAKLKLRKLKSAWIVPKLLLGSQSCTNYNITIHAKSGRQLRYISANFFGFSAKFQAENAKSILHPSHRLRQHHLRWRQHHLRWKQHHFRWMQHHFLLIFTIFCRFSPFFIDFYDLRTFVAIYILSRFTHFFRKFFWPKQPHRNITRFLHVWSVLAEFQKLEIIESLLNTGSPLATGFDLVSCMTPYMSSFALLVQHFNIR